MCFFRCLALHKGHHRMALETAAKSLFRQYTKECISDFKGVSFSKLNDLEQLFEVNVVVYELAEVKIEDEYNSENENESEIEDDSSETQSNSPESSSVEVAGRIVRRSLNRYKKTMYLNLYENHFSYITDIDKYAKSYLCQKCQKLWKTSKQLNRHMGSCQGKGTCYRYPGGFYVTPKTIFEKLEEEGILVPEKERYYPYRAVFDFESFFDKSVQSSPTDMLTWDMKHVPVSVSICSNVLGYEDAVCFISDGSTQKLISDMMHYLLEISQTSYKYLEETFDWVLKELSFRIENLDQLPNDEEDKGKRMRVHLQKLQSEFIAYLRELPVFGFNSGSYDTNLIKPYLYKFLKEDEEVKFMVKRNNNYMCIKTKYLKFLDVRNFLAPNFSYSAFLKAYDCQQQKGFFPYEWLDGLDKLESPQLPPYEDFFSSIKNENVCTGEEYEHCQQIWVDQKMKTMRDFLVWYNNLDVEPFVEGLGKMADFYKERHIDAFKDGISVPGLTMKYLFKISPQATFALFDEKNKDLHQTFKDNLVGGPLLFSTDTMQRDKQRSEEAKNVRRSLVTMQMPSIFQLS